MPGHFTHIYTARRVAQQLVDGNVFDVSVDGGDHTFEGLTPLLPGFDARTCGSIMQQWPHFTALGAVGPDLFFFSQDYSSGPLAAAPFQDDMIMLALATYFYLDRAKDDGWEPLLVLLAEVNTTFANILRILIQLNKLWQKFVQAWNDTIGPYVEDLEKALDDLSGGVLSAFSQAVSELVDGLIALVEQELLTFTDLFSWFALKMRTGWDEQAFVWSDMLHYRRTTRMVANLIGQATTKFAQDGDEREFQQYLAYAVGWAGHLGTDTIAHSFVNEQAGGPFRTHWQRHHLVENQMDAWHYRQVGDTGGAPADLHDPWGSTADYLDINNSAMAFFVALQDDPAHPERDGVDRPSPLPKDATAAKAAVDVDGDMPPWLSEGIVRALVETYHTPDEPDVEPRNYGGGPFQQTIATVFAATESLLADAGVDLTQPLSELIGAIAPDPPADLDVPEGYPLPWEVSTSYQIMMLFYRLSFWGGFNLEKPKQPDFVMLPPQEDLDALASVPDFSGPSSGDPVEDVCNAIKSVLDWLRKEADALGNFVGDLIETILSPGTYPVRWALYQAALFGWDMITTVHEVMTHLAFVYPHGEKRDADGEILLLDEIDRSVITLGATADAAFAQALADADDPFGNLDLNPDLTRGTRNPRERYPFLPVRPAQDAGSDPSEYRRPWAYPDKAAREGPGHTLGALYDTPLEIADQAAELARLGLGPDAVAQVLANWPAAADTIGQAVPGPYPQGAMSDDVLFRTDRPVDPGERAAYETAPSPVVSDWLNETTIGRTPDADHSPLGDPVPLSCYLIGRLVLDDSYDVDFNLDADRAYGYRCWDWVRGDEFGKNARGQSYRAPLVPPEGATSSTSPQPWPGADPDGQQVPLQLHYLDAAEQLTRVERARLLDPPPDRAAGRGGKP